MHVRSLVAVEQRQFEFLKYQLITVNEPFNAAKRFCLYKMEQTQFDTRTNVQTHFNKIRFEKNSKKVNVIMSLFHFGSDFTSNCFHSLDKQLKIQSFHNYPVL